MPNEALPLLASATTPDNRRYTANHQPGPSVSPVVKGNKLLCRLSSSRDGQQRDHSRATVPNHAIPKQVELWRIENLAIPACYLTVGIVQGLSGPLLNVYPLDLGASEAAQLTLGSITNFPGSLKVVFGFLSDNTLGGRRKPYMIVGWTAVVLSMGYLWLLQPGITSDGAGAVAPSIPTLGAVFFSLGVGMWLADVMGDALVAERAKLEPPIIKGRMQSSCYACRFFGMMVAAPLSTWLYSSSSLAGSGAVFGLGGGPQSVILLLLLSPLLLVLPLLIFFKEDHHHHHMHVNSASTKPRLETSKKSMQNRMQDIWKTVQSRSVWQPMAFIYLYNLLQVSNGAWRQFLKSVLQFTEVQLNSILIASYITLYLGTMLYKFAFLKTSWRKVYWVCMCLNGVLSALQLLLVYGKTFGLSPFLFAFGDEAFGEFVVGVQFLPVTIMMVDLCPQGSEGASYALFTTFMNAAIAIGPITSSMLLGIWDVTKDTLVAGELSGFVKLTLLTTALQMSPIFFLHWLPQNKSELMELSNQHGNKSRSRWGGIAFLTVPFLSILYSLVVGTLNIIYPNWIQGERS